MCKESHQLKLPLLMLVFRYLHFSIAGQGAAADLPASGKAKGY
jgi:hypothetical protein